MTRPAHVDAAIDQAYKLEAILRVAFEAAFENGDGFGKSGGPTVIGLAADMAGDIVSGLEKGEKARAQEV